MPTRFKKTRKERGGRQHGFGRIGGHTKHPGGRGKAGGLCHKRSNFDKYHPGYFGKLGMQNFHNHACMDYCPTINVDRIWSLIPESKRDAFLANKDATKAPVIDVTKYGYSKVIGRGILPEVPIVIKAKSFSFEAEAKIRAVGGVAVVAY